MQRVFVVCLLVLITTSGYGRDNLFVGTWSENPKWCGNTISRNGDETPIRITTKGMTGFEMNCRFHSVQDAKFPNPAWLVHYSCVGEKRQQKIVFVVKGDELLMVGGGAKTTMRR